MKMVKKVNTDSTVTCADIYDVHGELDDTMSAIGAILGIMERATSLSDEDYGPARAVAYVEVLEYEVSRMASGLTEVVKMCSKLTGQEETNE